MSSKLTLAIAGVAAVLILALAVVHVFVVAGGGGDDDDGNGQPAAERTETGDNGDDGDDEPAGDSELRLLGGDPLFLDPAVVQDAESAEYVVEIFSGLVRLDRNLQVQPDLAERWDVNPEGTVYTFHLDRDATFHDGRPVTADDVRYSFTRALLPETGSITAENFLGDIVGARDVSRGRATEVAGLKVLNPSTVEITITAPTRDFLYRLTYQTGFVVDEREIKANPSRWTLDPNGTGPYTLEEWRLGERIVLQAYDRHHLGPPKLKRVVFDLQGGSALVRYENGEIDVTGVGLDDLSRVQDPSDDLNAEYQTAAQQSISYVGFNTNIPPFDDPLVRQAFAMAVDRQRIAEVILEGAIPVATGLIPPGVPGHTPEDKTYAYDPDRARELLEQSSYGGDLPEITMNVSGVGASIGSTTEQMIENWRDNLGVEVQIEQTETGTFFQDIDEGRYQMFTLGWILDYPDAGNVVDTLFHSASRQNNTRYSNPEIDAQLEAARTETNDERRIQIYQEVERKLIEDAAWIPLYFDTTHYLVKPYVKNYIVPPTVIERFADVEVER
jgi:oligopeptide transport system substrate-binding protein